MAKRPHCDESGNPSNGWRMPEPEPTFDGYHQFPHADNCGYGSFEVFYALTDPTGETPDPAPGWYWWPCFPGCLPDGDPTGPFPTAEGAYLDAIGD